MKTLLILLLIISTNAFADEYRHLVSIDANGLGWSGSFERNETNSDSAFSDVETLVNNIAFNYGYRLSERFIVGGYFRNSNSEYKFNTSTSSAPVKSQTQTIGLFTLYNFSDTIASAWYTGISVAHFQIENEVSHDAALEEGKNPFELDDTGMIYEIVAGKRFRLLKWNIDHLTYSPQIGLFHKTHSKDFDDQNVKNGYGISFQPIKFDLLF